MSLNNGTGIVYPTIELGGREYEIKFTRGSIVYRLSRNGVNMADLGKGPKSFAAVVDVLHAIIGDQFGGTQDDLADLVMSEGKMIEVATALGDALKKVFPPTQIPIREAAESKPDQPVQ